MCFNNMTVSFDIKMKRVYYINKMDQSSAALSEPLFERLKRAFPDWKGFAEGFHASMSPSSEPVEAYEDLRSENVSDLDMVSGLLDAGYDPQEGLRAVLDACLLCPRYLHEVFEDLIAIVDAFVMRGASVAPLVGRLFDTRCGDSDVIVELAWADEDVESVARGKGMLIDVVSRHGVYTEVDWPSIPATDWEDLPEGFCRSCKWKMQLKYCSKYLQSL